MKVLGIILLVVGLAITIVTAVNFTTKKKVVDVGKLEVTKDEDHKLSWPPIVGVVVMVVGGGCYIIGIQKKSS